MADTEFEQFRQYFERLPQHIKATAQTYTLVHDLGLDDDTDGSSGSARSDTEEEGGGGSGTEGGGGGRGAGSRQRSLEDCLGGDMVRPFVSTAEITSLRHTTADGPPRGIYAWASATPVESGSCDVATGPIPNGQLTGANAGPPRERRRRRLPEIPQSAKNAAAAAAAAMAGYCSSMAGGPMSLAAELGAAGHSVGHSMGPPMGHTAGDLPLFAPGGVTRPLLVLKCAGLDGEGSPDSSLSMADSGHSTLHSPKSMSPQLHNGSLSPGSPTSSSLGGMALSFTQLELLEATHRGLYKFLPRHRDELEVEIGDPIYVQKEADDLWCEGVNLRTGRSGCFPSAYAVDLEYSELDPSEPRVRRERFLLRYLGSVETLRHKGTAVLAAAVRKMVGDDGQPRGPVTACVLEISDKGIRMSDSGRRKRPKSGPPLDYFYSLKHVSFCAFHPRDQRYVGFITKHPQIQRFACHVFLGNESTRPVAESVGRAFQRFYQKFVETAYPVEDIYID